MQTNAPAGSEFVDQYNRAVSFGQIGGANGAPLPAHASTHATDGSDPVTPASIGTVSFLNATAALNYGSIGVSGGFLDLDVTVTGAELDDWTSVDCVSIRGAGDGSRALIFSSFVSAANTVTVRAVNPTLVAVNPGSYTFKILVAKGV
jgi:hypothetical protein